MEQKYYGLGNDDTFFKPHPTLPHVMSLIWFDIYTGEQYEIERFRFENALGCYRKIEIYDEGINT